MYDQAIRKVLHNSGGGLYNYWWRCICVSNAYLPGFGGSRDA